jgi:Ser/Thr protein kinase RdoA (MazF antagonist)
MTATWPAIFQPVLTKLAADGTRYFGSNDIRLEPLQQFDRPFSTLLKVRVADRQGSQDAFIKIFKPRFDTPAQIAETRKHVRIDFDTMCRVQVALSGAHQLDAVRPIACFPEDLALVTGEAVGATMASLLTAATARWAGSSVRREALEALRQVGSWLRVVQSALPQDHSIELSRVRTYLNKRLDGLEASGSMRLTPAGRDSLERYQDRLFTAIATDRVPAVWIHADFCPENIIVHDGRVAVLDFLMAKAGTVYQDIAHLYMHVGVIAAKPWCKASSVRALQQELLAAFEPGLQPDRPLFALAFYQHVLCQLLVLQNATGGHVARLYAARLHQRQRRWLSQVAGLDRQSWTP